MSTERAKKLVERAGDRPLFSAEQAEIVAALSAAQREAEQNYGLHQASEECLTVARRSIRAKIAELSAAQQRIAEALDAMGNDDRLDLFTTTRVRSILGPVVPEPAETPHRVVEMFAGTWDAAGHALPRNWHWVCSCGERRDSLKDQVAAIDSWREHAAPVATADEEANGE